MEACKKEQGVTIEKCFAVWNWDAFLRVDTLFGVRQMSGVRITASPPAIFYQNSPLEASWTPSQYKPLGNVPHSLPQIMEHPKLPPKKSQLFATALKKYKTTYNNDCALLQLILDTGRATDDPLLLSPPFPHAELLHDASYRAPVTKTAAGKEEKNDSDRSGESGLLQVTQMRFNYDTEPPVAEYRCIWDDGPPTWEKWDAFYDAANDTLTAAAEDFINKNPKFNEHYRRTKGVLSTYGTKYPFILLPHPYNL